MKGLPIYSEERQVRMRWGGFRSAAKATLIAAALMILSAYLSGAFCSLHAHRSGKDEIGTIVWFPCESLPDTYQCGTLTVPLDHLNASDIRKAAIGIIRYQAGGGKTPKDQVKGSIIFNPGGPGGSGIDFLASQITSTPGQSAADKLDQSFNGTFDLVSFDPRGVGASTPNVNCFPDSNDGLIYRALDSFHGVMGSHTGHLIKSELGTTIAMSQLIADKCQAASDMFQYVGTSSVARDMYLLHKSLGDETLNFWGLSYGSILGMAYASIYPESVGRIVLDGVVDRDDWTRGEALQQPAEMEDTLTGFFRACHDNRESCSLSTLAQSAEELQKRVMLFINELKFNPIPVPTASPPQLLDYSAVIKLLDVTLTFPRAWPFVADSLFKLIQTRNPDGFPILDAFHPSKTDSTGVSLGVICGDSSVAPANPGESTWTTGELEDYLNKSMSISPNFGSWVALDGVFCKAWPLRAVEPFPVDMPNTSFPILAIGNEFDPRTPGKNAAKLASKHPNCVNVIREGYGHLSVSIRSRALEKILLEYFVMGTVPDNGTFCPTDEEIFSSEGRMISQFDTREALSVL